MKNLTNKKTNEQNNAQAKLKELKEGKRKEHEQKVAQCCAKTSRTVAGCHD